MPAPKLLIKMAILGGKMFGSLGLPHLIPIRKPHPLAVKVAKWYFLVAILPLLLIDMFVHVNMTLAYVVGGIGTAIGAWAFCTICYDWYMLRKAIAEELESEQDAADTADMDADGDLAVEPVPVEAEDGATGRGIGESTP